MKMTKVKALHNAINSLRAMDATDSTRVPNAVETIEVLENMITQLSKPRKTSVETKAKAKAKRVNARAELMAKVLPVLRDTLSNFNMGVTAEELYVACVDTLPDDFTSAKVRYILQHEMANEVVRTKKKGKPNTYQMRG